jgi:hypothetical protein
VWPAGHITLAGRPCVAAFPKTILSTCPTEVVLKVSNAQRWCNEETWPPGLTSEPPTPNLRLEHCLTPPINTTVFPPAERVKKVRFSPPKGPPNSIFVEYRERQGSEGWRTSWLLGSPQSSSSVEALSESISVRWSFPSSNSVECGSSVGILRISTKSRLSSPSGVSGSCHTQFLCQN